MPKPKQTMTVVEERGVSVTEQPFLPDDNGAPPAEKPVKRRPRAKRGGVKYPQIEAHIYEGKGKELTVAQAKEYIGWVAGKTVKEDDAVLTDHEGNRVALTNNGHNRPFDMSFARTWESEILKGNWRNNGDCLTIGRSGQTVSAQHRLVALILAAQEWKANPERWPFWKSEPTLPCIIITGINESDDVVNTIDTGKPRSLADVLYRSKYFAKIKSRRDRLALCRMADYAVRLLWQRTGAGIDAFTPRRTHKESVAFIDKHSKLIECVTHIHAENDGGKIAQLISPGYAAGLMYLMASSTTTATQAYYDSPSESHLDFARWDQASKFWVELSTQGERLAPVRAVLAKMIDDESDSVLERTSLISKAWALWSTDTPLDAENLRLTYHLDSDGVRTLIDTPTVGGVDGGTDHDWSDEAADDPSPEEIEERAAEERAARAKKQTPPNPSKQRGRPRGLVRS